MSFSFLPIQVEKTIKIRPIDLNNKWHNGICMLHGLQGLYYERSQSDNVPILSKTIPALSIHLYIGQFIT